MESVPPGNSGPAPTADGVLPPLPESRPESVGTTTARARPPPPVFTRPTISVQVSLPQGGRYSRARSRGGLKLRLTATLVGAEAGAVSLLRRGTIFDGACPLLGRGGFWGVADAQRRPVRIEHDPDADGATKRCTRTHVRAGEGFLAFEDNFTTLLPNQPQSFEKLIPAAALVGLRAGAHYTLYSRPDREKKRPATARCKSGARDDIAECAVWLGDADADADADDGGDGDGDGNSEAWAKLDVSHIVRDRDWDEIEIVVANSARFVVV